MQIRQLNNKLVIVEATNQEKLMIRRSCIGVKNSGSILYVDDNLVNRIALNYFPEKFYDVEHPSKIGNLHPSLRDYQRNDVIKMLSLQNILNRNKPGYGKTFETVEFCRLLNLKKILIVCPKSVIPQWAKQFILWWPEVEPNIQVGGRGPERRSQVIYVTNYEQLTPQCVGHQGRKKILQPTQVWQKCKQWIWDLVVLDESHRIKNPVSQITGAIKQIPSKQRMCLSGTPILGHPNDLWSQLDFLDSKWAGNNYWNFTSKFCEIEDNGFGKKPIGLTPSENAQNLLGKLLACVSVGGNNQDVTEGKNYITIELPMTIAQRNLYKDIVNLSLDSLEEKGITVKNAMDQIIKQQQVTTNCCKFTEAGCKTNPKFDWVKDWLEDNEGESLVVFTKFAEVAQALSNYLSKNKIKNVIFIGEMSSSKRQVAKNMFVQHSADCRVLIGTIGALGTGTDGLQYVCSNVVFLDRDWTPGLNQQAEDRVNRSGAKGMTNIWILSMEKSIDSYVEGIQSKKAQDIEEVFKRVGNSIRSW